MNALSKGNMLVIVEDANGTFQGLGADEYVYANAGSGNIGASKSDGNNYQITLLDESSEFPFTLTAKAIEELKAMTQNI